MPCVWGLAHEAECFGGEGRRLDFGTCGRVFFGEDGSGHAGKNLLVLAYNSYKEV